jgi:hypothetical protein
MISIPPEGSAGVSIDEAESYRRLSAARIRFGAEVVAEVASPE